MNIRITALACAAGLLSSLPAGAQITVYENDNFQGRSYTTPVGVSNLMQRGFNDRASSAVVGGNRAWEICDNSDYGGACRVLRPGQYPSLTSMGMNNRVSSLRVVGNNNRLEPDRYAPQPVVSGDYRRRNGEGLFEAPVIASRAVYQQQGDQGQRCWIEREQVDEGRSDARVPGALLGAVIGGILGHQIGGGSGRDLATVGGVVAGGVVGSKIGQGHDGPGSTREVQRCSSEQRTAPLAYWDVSYRFRGVVHRVQLTQAPGATVTVNRRGEPRG